MRYLIDDRNPITTDDIDRAIEDASAYLDGPVFPDHGQYNLIERLAAIVRNAYGYAGDNDENPR